MSNIPYNYNQYMDDVTKLRQRGTVSTGEQVKSPNSAGSRGLARVEAFADGPNQLIKLITQMLIKNLNELNIWLACKFAFFSKII